MTDDCKNINFTYVKNSLSRMCEALDHIPKGWKPIKDAWTAPKGYKWYYNGKSIFSDEYQSALVKIED